jgi:hypothetical protein
MPEIGKIFYETGPALGIAWLNSYLRTRELAPLGSFHADTVQI